MKNLSKEDAIQLLVKMFNEKQQFSTEQLDHLVDYGFDIIECQNGFYYTHTSLIKDSVTNRIFAINFGYNKIYNDKTGDFSQPYEISNKDAKELVKLQTKLNNLTLTIREIMKNLNENN